MVRGHKGLEVRHVFYFYFFPTSCLSEVSHGLPPRHRHHCISLASQMLRLVGD